MMRAHFKKLFSVPAVPERLDKVAVTSYSAYISTGLSVEIVHCKSHIRFFSLRLGLLAI